MNIYYRWLNMDVYVLFNGLVEDSTHDCNFGGSGDVPPDRTVEGGNQRKRRSNDWGRWELHGAGWIFLWWGHSCSITLSITVNKSCWFSPTWCMYPNISENTWSIWQLQIWFTWPCRALSCSVVLCTFRITRNTCRSARTVKLGQIGGSIDIRLVVWNMNFISPYIGNFIIPTDELIFFRRVAQPPTRYWLMAWCRSRLGDGEDQTLRGEPREAADQSTTGTRWPILDVECGVFHRDVGCFWTFVKHGESHGFWEPAGCWATTSWHQKAGGFQPGDGMREGFYRKIMKIGVFIVTF